MTIYRGWIVLAAVFLSAMLLIGSTVYSFQLFVLPISNEFGFGRAQISLGYIALLLGMAAWSPLVGRLLDRYPARGLFAAGGVAFGLGCLLLSRAQSGLTMMLAILLLIGPAMCAAGGLAANTLTTRWFERRRGRALGLVTVASSVGGFVMVPVMTWLIETRGWREAILWTGLVSAGIILLLAVFVVRGRPSASFKRLSNEFGMESPDSLDSKHRSGEPEWDFKKLLRSRIFWLIALGAGLLLASDQAVLTSQYPYFIENGLSPAQAASIISAMTFSAIFGKLLVGWLVERVDVRHLFALVGLFHVGLLLMFLWMPGFTLLLVFVSFFGAAVGGIYPVWASLIAQHFGARSFGVAFGSTSLVMQLLASTFVWWIGSSYDRTGSYRLAFFAFLFAVVAGVVLIYLTGPGSPRKIGQGRIVK